MTTQILATKLYIPAPAPHLVMRPRLLQCLEQSTQRKLTLISAPAGFGKTTLVSGWLQADDTRTAWLSLDSSDSDPIRFLIYLVAALQQIAPEVGAGMVKLLEAPQPPPIHAHLTTLLNQIAAIPHRFVLVLDDLHTLNTPEIDNALAFLIDHQPPQMHLVIITREDPPLPLARWRARGQLAELRAADLRFTPEEATNFLNQAMGLSLSAGDIAALEKRTEGWIAGLQLAAISLHDTQNTADFIESFTGSHHFVLDYLVEEVLSRQPAAIQAFLLRTSILDRMCGALCDALLQHDTPHAQAMLESIQHANLFLVPLDSERRWYRYHHLFGDLLRKRLHQAADVDVNAMHRRASDWFEANGFVVEAFQHAAAAGDVQRALRLIKGDGIPLYFRGVIKPILDWFGSLPPHTFQDTPALLVMYASALMITGTQIGSIEEKLQTAEAILAAHPPDDDTRDLLGHIAAVRGMLAGPCYDIETMLIQADRALACLQPENMAIRTMAMWSKGLAHQYRGEREAAREVYAEVVTNSQQTGNVMVTIAALTCVGQLQEANTHLHRAESSYQQVVDICGSPPWSTACEAFLGLARLHYQWNHLDRAREYARQGYDLGKQIENVDTPVVCGVLLADIARASGDTAAAAAKLTETAQFARQHGFHSQLPRVWAAQVRVLLAQGDVSAAAHLTQAHDLPLSRVRVLLAQGDPVAALAIIHALQSEYEAKAWHQERLQTLTLAALAHAQHGDTLDAERVLTEALTLASSSGYIRLFVDEGDPMRALIAALAGRGVLPAYTRQLLAAFSTVTAQPHHSQPLIDPLSDRELEILQLVAAGLSNREIAKRLFLALDTVKGHNRRIYAKLDVKRRTEAVARARELGLI